MDAGSNMEYLCDAATDMESVDATESLRDTTLNTIVGVVIQYIPREDLGELVIQLLKYLPEEHFHQLYKLIDNFERGGDPTQLSLEHRIAVVKQLLPTLPAEEVASLFKQQAQGDWEEWE